MSNRNYLTFNYPTAISGKTLLTGIRPVEEDSRSNAGTDKDKDKSWYITGFFKIEDLKSNAKLEKDKKDGKDGKEGEGIKKKLKDAPPTISFLYKGNLGSCTSCTSRAHCVRCTCCTSCKNQEVQGTFYALNYPSSSGVTVSATNLYGPNDLGDGLVRVVGNYTTEEMGASAIACMYTGCPDGRGIWETLTPIFPNVTVTTAIAHSNDGNFAVGGYTVNNSIFLKGFLYDIEKKKYHNIIKPDDPNVKSITGYGIINWKREKKKEKEKEREKKGRKGDKKLHSCSTSRSRSLSNMYTICGGYVSSDIKLGFESAFLVDWNAETETFSNFQTFYYNNSPHLLAVTHFNGISFADPKGISSGFTLTGDTDFNKSKGFFAHVSCAERSNASNGSNGSNGPPIGQAIWQDISFPNSFITSGNSISQDIVIGVYSNELGGKVNGYVSCQQP